MDNPFLSAIDTLDSSIYLVPVSLPAFFAQLLTLRILFGIILIICISTIALRWRNGELWFFRMVVAAKGGELSKSGLNRVISPNSAVLYTCFSIIYFAVGQGYISSLYDFATPGADLSNSVWWKTVNTTPLFFGAYAQAYATMVFSVINREPLGKFDLARWPNVVNSFMVIPFIVICTIFPLTSIASNYFNKLFITYRQLRSVLENASNSILASKAPDLSRAPALEAELLELSDVLVRTWQRCWIAWLVFTVFVVLLFFGAAIQNFRSLSGKIKNSSDSETRSAYRGLIFITVVIVFAGTIEVGIVLYLSIATANTSQSIYPSLVTLLSLWTSFVLGIVNVAIFIKSFPSPSGSPIKGGPQISTHSNLGAADPSKNKRYSEQTMVSGVGNVEKDKLEA